MDQVDFGGLPATCVILSILYCIECLVFSGCYIVLLWALQWSYTTLRLINGS